MAAILVPAGVQGNAGAEPKGITQQYQKSATVSSSEALSTIHPYDSGTILGHVQPGGAGEKLVSGVVQRSSQIVADATPGVVGNALVAISGVGLIPTPPAGSTAADGLSQAPQHE